jgi:hypothetical protein
MATWDRSTPWRQGTILTAEATKSFGLTSESQADRTAVVVVSHDCDLAQLPQHERAVEVIVGRFVDKADGNYEHGKNVRCLHLAVSAGSQRCTVELEPRNRVQVPKCLKDAVSLADFAPAAEFSLTPRELRTLRRWLAARYDRPAFSDEFERRIKDTGVAERLAKAFRETGHYIPAMYFDVDGGQDIARKGDNDPYVLGIQLLYLTHEDGNAAERAAVETAEKIRGIFKSRCVVKNENGVDEWRWIELHYVDVIADQALTYAQSTQLVRWNADYLSLRADPQQPTENQQ